jgi:rhamnose utilization protein RhaD (predicted bifunctional aldolase and dehydrogenase)
MIDLNKLVDLSHEFGSKDYVKGGGGNTSAKNNKTLWVKPSGTTLAGLKENSFVAMDRAKINELYKAQTPQEPAAREELVKDLMAAAVSGGEGRPSVEAPLHNVFDARYVVHTHPALVNGLTCAAKGEDACKRLFPDALWLEYIDPGYTLCMAARERIEQFKSRNSSEPQLVILQNHGIFVAANTAEEIQQLYSRVMKTLRDEYAEKGLDMYLAVSDAPEPNETSEIIPEILGEDGQYISSSGMFKYAPGPISPDHLVYSKAFPFAGELTREALSAYKAERGYAPKVVVTDNRVYGIGTSQKNADLALELAQDGALVMQLTEAFGGIHFMSDAQREFIENWEVESYRQKQVEI